MAFSAVDAFVRIHFELVPLASHRSLQRSHGAEGAPGPGGYYHPEEDGDRCGENAEGYKDHADPVHNAVCIYDAIDHKSHEQDEYGCPQPHAAKESWNLQLPAKGSQPEVDKASPRAEISTEPAPSEGGYDHQAGKDQEQEEAQLGIKYAANGYYQHYDAKIGGNLQHIKPQISFHRERKDI